MLTQRYRGLRMTKIISNPYEKLAKTLNKIPESFPTNEQGLHIKLLKWIFTEDEADLASKMKLRGETVGELSSRLDLPIEGLADKLESMVIPECFQEMVLSFPPLLLQNYNLIVK